METSVANTSKNLGEHALSEMREFAGFPAQTQRYIRCSIDIGLERADAESIWARDQGEGTVIKAQRRIYEKLPNLRETIPTESGLNVLDPFMGTLITVTAFDLGQSRLPNFLSYRFLYERLLGATVRPWLPSAFCAAASLPHLQPERRKTLLQSISEAAATAPGWSRREPTFYPEWVEKVE
jgi:hypothetical protein